MDLPTPTRTVVVSWNNGRWELVAKFPRDVSTGHTNIGYWTTRENLSGVDKSVIDAIFALREEFASMMPSGHIGPDQLVLVLSIGEGRLHPDDLAHAVRVLKTHLPHFLVDAPVLPVEPAED
jgi:hypothetical protein